MPPQQSCEKTRRDVDNLSAYVSDVLEQHVSALDASFAESQSSLAKLRESHYEVKKEHGDLQQDVRKLELHAEELSRAATKPSSQRDRLPPPPLQQQMHRVETVLLRSEHCQEGIAESLCRIQDSQETLEEWMRNLTSAIIASGDAAARLENWHLAMDEGTRTLIAGLEQAAISLGRLDSDQGCGPRCRSPDAPKAPTLDEELRAAHVKQLEKENQEMRQVLQQLAGEVVRGARQMRTASGKDSKAGEPDKLDADRTL
ncbi:hypothetical protein KC349_g8682 [Hortaea werneckii]|nr:hypothetical protein KC349_g8682 [Hortaea werneckii]